MKSREVIASWLNRQSVPGRTTAVSITPGRRMLLHECPVAGFQHHRGEGVWAFLRVGDLLQLRREWDNLHDRYAVAVWFRNEHIGYLPQTENRTLAQLLDRGESLDARISRLIESDNPWRRVRISVFLAS